MTDAHKLKVHVTYLGPTSDDIRAYVNAAVIFVASIESGYGASLIDDQRIDGREADLTFKGPAVPLSHNARERAKIAFHVNLS